MKQLAVGFALCGTLFGAQMAFATLESVTVPSSFQACRNVQVLNSELTEDQHFEFMARRSKNGLQRMPEMTFLKGIAHPSSIAKSIHLMKLVADRKIQNIQSNLRYYAAVKSCFQENQKPNSHHCEVLLRDFDQNNKAVTPLLRRELALSMNYHAGAGYSAVPRAHINTSLRAIPGLPNPAGTVALTDAEMQLAESDFAADLAIVKHDVNALMAQLKLSIAQSGSQSGRPLDELQQKIEFLKDAYHKQLLKRQANYTRILSQNPHLAFYPQGALVSKKALTRQEVVNAIDDLFNAGITEIASIENSRKQNELEFSRANGDAVWRSYFKGEVELLQFITSPVVEEVLKENLKYCAIAERLLQRASIKDLQNLVASNLLLGVGPGSGLLGVAVHGVVGTAHALGIAKGISIAASVKTASNISMAIAVGAGAARFHRHQAHTEANPISHYNDRN